MSGAPRSDTEVRECDAHARTSAHGPAVAESARPAPVAPLQSDARTSAPHGPDAAAGHEVDPDHIEPAYRGLYLVFGLASAVAAVLLPIQPFVRGVALLVAIGLLYMAWTGRAPAWMRDKGIKLDRTG